jgi:hypothetical protein
MPVPGRPPPMALTFSLTNIMKFLSYMAPFLISFFMIMFTILTGSIVKGLIFISGLLIVTFMNYLLKNSLKSLQDPLASPFCNSLPAPFTLRAEQHIFNSPSTSSTIIAFTFAYLAYPMILKPQNLNPVLIAFLVALLGINGAVEVQDRCTSVSGIFLGSLVGILFGIIFFSLVKISGNESLAFFTEQGSNGIQCSKPGKTQFKCVTKHGSVDSYALNSDQPFINNSKFVLPEFKVDDKCRGIGDIHDNYSNDKDEDYKGSCRIGCGGQDSLDMFYSEHSGQIGLHFDVVQNVESEHSCKNRVLADLNKYKAYEYHEDLKKCELWKVVPGAIRKDDEGPVTCKVFSRDGNIVPAEFGVSNSRIGSNLMTEIPISDRFVNPIGCNPGKKSQTDGVGGCRVVCTNNLTDASRNEIDISNLGVPNIDFDVQQVADEITCQKLVIKSNETYKAYEWNGKGRCELWKIVPETDSGVIEGDTNSRNVKCRIRSTYNNNPVNPSFSYIRANIDPPFAEDDQ